MQQPVECNEIERVHSSWVFESVPLLGTIVGFRLEGLPVAKESSLVATHIRAHLSLEAKLLAV